MKPRVKVQVLAGFDEAELPDSLDLRLEIHDRDVITELWAFPEGDSREEFALQALRIGVLALRQARGQLDTEQIRREGERLMSGLESKLGEHARGLHERLGTVLSEYFHPESGRFHERVDRLVRQDGELEQLLRRQIGSQDSQLCQTLAAHVGQDSPILKEFERQLAMQRDHVLKQFSLDNKEGALCRFLAEIMQHHGKLSQALQGQVNEVMREFSLDKEDSALNRLVRNVERAQRTITSEFSLDNEQSALARLKREVLGLLNEQRDTSQKFQEEVKIALQTTAARREEAARGMRHGIEFEEAVILQVQQHAQRAGDIATPTRHNVGQLPYCKVGDCLIELGPESIAPGARIVVEAKEDKSYTLAAAREEIEKARSNRGAQVGLFVFSSKTTSGMEPLARYGHDVFVVWDPDDPNLDVILWASYSVARAISVRGQQDLAAQSADLAAIDEAIERIQHRAAVFDELERLTTTIHRNSSKILKKVGTARKSLRKDVEVLREKTQELRGVLVGQVANLGGRSSC